MYCTCVVDAAETNIQKLKGKNKKVFLIMPLFAFKTTSHATSTGVFYYLFKLQSGRGLRYDEMLFTSEKQFQKNVFY